MDAMAAGMNNVKDRIGRKAAEQPDEAPTKGEEAKSD